MSEYHALLSPSGAAKWIACPNSIAAEKGQPDAGNRDAAQLGTDKHTLLATCLGNGYRAEKFIGVAQFISGNIIDADFVNDVQLVLSGVRHVLYEYEESGAQVQLEIEQAVPIGHITGEQGATGTADIVVLATWPNGRAEICVIDAKFGYREVGAENNAQMMLYALGALEKFKETKFFTARLMIAQPAVSETFSEWSIDVAELQMWAKTIVTPAATKAQQIFKGSDRYALTLVNYNPGDKQCQWCNAKAVCPARARMVQDILGRDFAEVDETLSSEMLTNDQLGDIWQVLDFVESWAKAVRGRIEYELLQGNAVAGVKLVEGRRGNRSWEDDANAEALLKSFRLKTSQMYTLKLMGPKAISEVLKLQPRRLKKVEALITQRAGKPHVAHESDKRAALDIKPVADEFDAIVDNSDLV